MLDNFIVLGCTETVGPKSGTRSKKYQTNRTWSIATSTNFFVIGDIMKKEKKKEEKKLIRLLPNIVFTRE